MEEEIMFRTTEDISRSVLGEAQDLSGLLAERKPEENYDEQIREMEARIRANPLDRTAHYLAGRAHAGRGREADLGGRWKSDKERALELLNRALEREPAGYEGIGTDNEIYMTLLEASLIGAGRWEPM